MTDFIRIEGGQFLMGSNHHYPEEAPQHHAEVDPFELATTSVTNVEFAAFVEATGYITVAERTVAPFSFPGAGDLEPGSLVFTPTDGPVDLREWQQWWHWVPGTSWKHPFGPTSDIAGKEDHAVVQVSYEDAYRYCEWAKARLPTEAEWELACRGGLEGATYAWGEAPNNGNLANSWQGSFPYENRGARGWAYTAPVGTFPPNRFGLYEMTGNVWEWTSSNWTPSHKDLSSHADDARDHSSSDVMTSMNCCSPTSNRSNATGSRGTLPSSSPAQRSRVVKGGSHLCSPDYCLRYRPAARSPQTEDSATTHIGFRLAHDL
ncbi:Formylglycine-generating enzyme, required for sulfatase activity, contains SUMF1/FGE domain [Brevibacterium aurantiacum]|uniref:Formylglycine-generating enzyme, required for sulfatase activity, contains SUMF1/FGE domain n=1 Tax=Brevibacterium aurantiacum TaxID=273384 RepID=A0A2H1JU78_BREAU|nr:formylglycine-generating enzyme family protein [Brevibacterium aurantiacum]SMX91019.1 Formylglycine-generating enzyme, required for sulfatase activity, contains SUMF1/FGE domain [Brevibacterium aurantiacum]